MATKICKVCGKEYDCCKSGGAVGTFRWQDVACCVDHGMAYLKAIKESRNEPLPKEVANYYGIKERKAEPRPAVEAKSLEVAAEVPAADKPSDFKPRSGKKSKSRQKHN